MFMQEILVQSACNRILFSMELVKSKYLEKKTKIEFLWTEQKAFRTKMSHLLLPQNTAREKLFKVNMFS